MTKIFIAALSGALIAAASPAFAADSKADQPTEASAPATPVAKTVNKGPKYCVIDTVTGSRVPIKTCHTREEWLRYGFDPLDK